ncbi:MAG: M14-type cytosolic carboxypeptidase [Robiginitomaculum sp.]
MKLTQHSALKISSNFDGGNIICKSCETSSDIHLDIRKDNKSDFYQWFYFRLSGAAGEECKLTIDNANGAAFTGGWDGYNACASYDKKDWFRVPTRFEDEKLIIEHTPMHGSVYYSYFAPYSMEMHANLIASTQMLPDVYASVLGETLDGQDMDLLTIGDPGKGKKVMWVIGRQHPGEIMAEWWMEGFLSRLLDDDDPTARVLRTKCVFYIVPNMNPDGSKRGHLRTNACGANLNREWGVATMERSPEVLMVMQAMEATDVDFCLDVHGDETLPYNFIAGAEGVPGYTKQGAKWLADFKNAYKQFSPDFQIKFGYNEDAPGSANLTLCTNYVAETHNCLAMTLEMPFKDNADLPDLEYGWSPERASRLGADVLGAMLAVVDDL